MKFEGKELTNKLWKLQKPEKLSNIETSRIINEAAHPIFGTAEEMEKMTAEDFYKKMS